MSVYLALDDASLYPDTGEKSKVLAGFEGSATFFAAGRTLRAAPDWSPA